MSIYRIGETQSKPETIEDLREFLISIMPVIKSSQALLAAAPSGQNCFLAHRQ